MRVYFGKDEKSTLKDWVFKVAGRCDEICSKCECVSVCVRVWVCAYKCVFVCSNRMLILPMGLLLQRYNNHTCIHLSPFFLLLPSSELFSNVLSFSLSRLSQFTMKHTFGKRGRLYPRDLPIIWKEYTTSMHAVLVELLQRFEILYPLVDKDTNERYYLIPSMLPAERPGKL